MFFDVNLSQFFSVFFPDNRKILLKKSFWASDILKLDFSEQNCFYKKFLIIISSSNSLNKFLIFLNK